MPFFGGLISGAGSLLGGIFGGSSAKDASNAQSAAINRAIQLQEMEYKDIAAKMLPFLKMGTTAGTVLGRNYFGINPEGGYDPNAPFLQPISATVGAPPNPNDPALRDAFRASPGYQYALQQSGNAIQNSAAGRTGAVSGNMLRALQGNATGLANNDWWNNYNAVLGNYANRYSDIANQRSTIIGGLGSLAGAGQNAAAQLGGFGQSAVNNIGGLLGTLGSSQAAGILGQSNALSSGIGGALNNIDFGALFGALGIGGGGGGGGFPSGATPYGSQFLTPSGDFAGGF
jgi:hypothetical protein